MPNFKWYYWAAQLKAAMFWFTNENTTPWLQIEANTMAPLPLNLYLYSASLPKLKKATSNPFVKNTIVVWYDVLKHI